MHCNFNLLKLKNSKTYFRETVPREFAFRVYIYDEDTRIFQSLKKGHKSKPSMFSGQSGLHAVRVPDDFGSTSKIKFEGGFDRLSVCIFGEVLDNTSRPPWINPYPPINHIPANIVARHDKRKSPVFNSRQTIVLEDSDDALMAYGRMPMEKPQIAQPKKVTERTASSKSVTKKKKSVPKNPVNPRYEPPVAYTKPQKTRKIIEHDTGSDYSDDSEQLPETPHKAIKMKQVKKKPKSPPKPPKPVRHQKYQVSSDSATDWVSEADASSGQSSDDLKPPKRKVPMTARKSSGDPKRKYSLLSGYSSDDFMNTRPTPAALYEAYQNNIQAHHAPIPSYFQVSSPPATEMTWHSMHEPMEMETNFHLSKYANLARIRNVTASPKPPKKKMKMIKPQKLPPKTKIEVAIPVRKSPLKQIVPDVGSENHGSGHAEVHSSKKLQLAASSSLPLKIKMRGPAPVDKKPPKRIIRPKSLPKKPLTPQPDEDTQKNSLAKSLFAEENPVKEGMRSNQVIIDVETPPGSPVKQDSVRNSPSEVETIIPMEDLFGESDSGSVVDTSEQDIVQMPKDPETRTVTTSNSETREYDQVTMNMSRVSTTTVTVEEELEVQTENESLQDENPDGGDAYQFYEEYETNLDDSTANFQNPNPVPADVLPNGTEADKNPVDTVESQSSESNADAASSDMDISSPEEQNPFDSKEELKTVEGEAHPGYKLSSQMSSEEEEQSEEEMLDDILFIPDLTFPDWPYDADAFFGQFHVN